jgi:multidrug efflux system outer membrane protein
MRFLPLVFVLALGGCQFGPAQPELTAMALPGHFSEAPGGGARDPQAQWWKAFGDPTLDRLIAQGVEGNLDIAQARARIAAADTQIVVANSGLLPTVTLGLADTTNHNVGSATYRYPSYRSSGGSLSSTWLLDFFGQVRAQTDSAQAAADAERAGRDAARLTVISNIAKAYVDRRYYEERLRVGLANLSSERRTLELTQRMKAQGVASDLDVAKVQQTVDKITAELPTLDASRLQAAHRIATLMGKPADDPQTLAEGAAGQPTPGWSAGAGVPADLLRNRPDIGKAEQEFAGAVADIGYAWSQFFPSVTLSGSVTPAYLNMKPKTGDLTTWGFGPSLRLPIFDGGTLSANYKAAIARAEQKRDAWRAAVLNAVEEVENALTAYHRERVALATLERRVATAQKAETLSRMSYEQGLSSLLDVLDSERSSYDAQAALVESRRNLASDYVTLNIALARGLDGPGRAAPVAGARQDLPPPLNGVRASASPAAPAGSDSPPARRSP